MASKDAESGVRTRGRRRKLSVSPTSRGPDVDKTLETRKKRHEKSAIPKSPFVIRLNESPQDKVEPVVQKYQVKDLLVPSQDGSTTEVQIIVPCPASPEQPRGMGDQSLKKNKSHDGKIDFYYFSYCYSTCQQTILTLV